MVSSRYNKENQKEIDIIMKCFIMDTSEEILNQYAPLVKRIAKSACCSSAAIDIADLCQIGEMAVLRAIKVYDASSGTNIKSFITRIVKQDIYNEAARFLGVFTVDSRVTRLAAKVNRLILSGKTEEEIVDILNKNTSNRNFDINHVKDLKMVYSRRKNALVTEDIICDNDVNIETTLEDAATNQVEKDILKMRIFGSVPVPEVCSILSLPSKRVYEIENILKERIKKIIEDINK